MNVDEVLRWLARAYESGRVKQAQRFHTVWRLPDGDADFSLRWRLIKHDLASGIAVAANRRGEKAVWQRRF